MNNAKEDLLATCYNSISNEDLIKECMSMGLRTPDPNIPYHTYIMDDVADRLKELIEENKNQKAEIDRLNFLLKTELLNIIKDFVKRLKEKATDIGVCDAQGNNYGGATVVFINELDTLIKEMEEEINV